ncbi:hypothetical protein [Oceanobacillus profundus]|uniref:Uncharacterized protein n=1 Tax=Oceanobacillus profundus TaxID=372463 RepID=A0A417YA43_9BACI|nr:hypothetical protein [Oceanobacillus profundus]MBR3118513.1 hypothetical protein [Oceanobacillus sp.]PAE27468.1 hypothetical protein CHI07_19255 [Paenibacillus sp. 7884-2]MCM3400454.1 hypothetical protein [Oceanobacillus profundus]MDO6448747.1 hypothetical protein [Oceanobacillus profundus]RHW29560.1 hypothetical protein D1B32_21480 [Oceanobacillus profundus]
MGRQINGLLYFFITDIRYSLMIFWTILLGILGVSLTISYFLLGVEDGSLYFMFQFIYVYCGILGFITVRESIPFALKMGATRKNLFISLGLFFAAIALMKAVIANTLHTIILYFTDVTNLHTFGFMHVAQLMEDTWVNRVIIDMSVMFLFLTVMFLTGLIFYRYGLLGGGIVVGIEVIILFVGIAQGWLIDFFTDLFSDLKLTLFLQIFGIGIVIYLISFLLIRRVTTVSTK